MAESNIYWWRWSIAFACWRCESRVGGVIHQGRLHSLGLVWRQRLVQGVQRGLDDSLYWHRRVRCYKVDCLAFFLVFFLIFLIHPEPFYPFATYLSHLHHHQNCIPFIPTFHKLLPLFTPILLHISRCNLVTTKFKQF